MFGCAYVHINVVAYLVAYHVLSALISNYEVILIKIISKYKVPSLPQLVLDINFVLNTSPQL